MIINSMTIQDLRCVSVNCRNSWELLHTVCGKNSTALYSFQRNFENLQYQLKQQNPGLMKICIPLKDGRHTTLSDVLMLASSVRLNVCFNKR